MQNIPCTYTHTCTYSLVYTHVHMLTHCRNKYVPCRLEESVLGSIATMNRILLLKDESLIPGDAGCRVISLLQGESGITVAVGEGRNFSSWVNITCRHG